MKRIFLDGNVIFTAAHNPAGKSALLFELGQKGYWELITSQLACEEARRNIGIKFPECLPEVDKILKDIKIIPHTTQSSCPLELPDKDKPIFLAAIQGRATHLLTGDLTHFGPFMNKTAETQGILIQTVSEFLLSIIE